MFSFSSLLVLAGRSHYLDLPIIRSAGLLAILEEVAGEALLDDNFSAMTEAPLKAWLKLEQKFMDSFHAEKCSGGLA